MDIRSDGVKRILAVAAVVLLASGVLADAGKGKRYYMKNFKQKFNNLSGADFVQLHTQAEWEALFADGAKGFIAEFSRKYPKQAAYLSDPKLGEKLRHLGDFAVTYASDSGQLPSCGEAPTESIDLEAKESSSAGYF